MEFYERFKSELADLCERGKITKNTKRTFSGYAENINPGEIVFSACSDLYKLFESAPPRSEEYALVCECVRKLLDGAAETAPDVLKHDYEFLSSFLSLTAKANGIAKPYAIEQVAAFSEQYNKSLQSVKYGLPLF